jgi:hypothetical protein
MSEQAAQIGNIVSAGNKKQRLFTSYVSATAIVALFVVLGVRLLETM